MKTKYYKLDRLGFITLSHSHLYQVAHLPPGNFFLLHFEKNMRHKKYKKEQHKTTTTTYTF